jgi:phage tail sheath gpL-like
MALIPITGLPSSYRVPGGYAEVLFAQGASSAALRAREVVIVMPKTSGGDAVAGELYPIGSEDDAIARAGVGSPAHRAARIFLKANKRARLWYLGMSATTGGTEVAATGTITYTTTATGTGVASVTVCGETVSAIVRSGDTVSDIAVKVKNAINAVTHLPVTADNSSGVVTMTARIAGSSQGDGTVPVIRYRATISAGIGTTVATSGAALGLGAGADGADGSTTEAAQLATALGSLEAIRKYYIVTSTWATAGLAALALHVSNKSEPNPGLRSFGICGYTGTLAGAQTLANARNYERLALVHQAGSEHDPAELAGNVAAIVQKHQARDSAANLDSYRQQDWLIKPPFSAADYPDGDDLNDAINDGITAIGADDNGSYLTMWLTTRSKNAAGTVDDFRATEAHRVSVADEFVDEMLATYAIRYSNAKLRSDQTLADGSVDPNQRIPGGVVTAETLKPFIKQQLNIFEDTARIQNAEASKESLRTVRDPSNSGRVEAGLELHAIDHLHQLTARVAEVSTG